MKIFIILSIAIITRCAPLDENREFEDTLKDNRVDTLNQASVSEFEQGDMSAEIRDDEEFGGNKVDNEEERYEEDDDMDPDEDYNNEGDLGEKDDDEYSYPGEEDDEFDDLGGATGGLNTKMEEPENIDTEEEEYLNEQDKNGNTMMDALNNEEIINPIDQNPLLGGNPNPLDGDIEGVLNSYQNPIDGGADSLVNKISNPFDKDPSPIVSREDGEALRVFGQSDVTEQMFDVGVGNEIGTEHSVPIDGKYGAGNDINVDEFRGSDVGIKNTKENIINEAIDDEVISSVTILSPTNITNENSSIFNNDTILETRMGDQSETRNENAQDEMINSTSVIQGNDGVQTNELDIADLGSESVATNFTEQPSIKETTAEEEINETVDTNVVSVSENTILPVEVNTKIPLRTEQDEEDVEVSTIEKIAQQNASLLGNAIHQFMNENENQYPVTQDSATGDNIAQPVLPGDFKEKIEPEISLGENVSLYPLGPQSSVDQQVLDTQHQNVPQSAVDRNEPEMGEGTLPVENQVDGLPNEGPGINDVALEALKTSYSVSTEVPTVPQDLAGIVYGGREDAQEQGGMYAEEKEQENTLSPKIDEESGRQFDTKYTKMLASIETKEAPDYEKYGTEVPDEDGEKMSENWEEDVNENWEEEEEPSDSWDNGDPYNNEDSPVNDEDSEQEYYEDEANDTYSEQNNSFMNKYDLNNAQKFAIGAFGENNEQEYEEDYGSQVEFFENAGKDYSEMSYEKTTVGNFEDYENDDESEYDESMEESIEELERIEENQARQYNDKIHEEIIEEEQESSFFSFFLMSIVIVTAIALCIRSPAIFYSIWSGCKSGKIVKMFPYFSPGPAKQGYRILPMGDKSV